MTYCIFINDVVVGMFVCDTELQATEELKRLKLAFRGYKFIIEMVKQ